MVHPSHPGISSEHKADLCFALSDPKRIDIVHALAKRPYNVNELTAELGIPQPMTSRHLKILRERGLVQFTRHGVSVTYALSDLRLIQALELLNDISNKEGVHRLVTLSQHLEISGSQTIGGFHAQE
jgi:DNA-binding transcriptional ArsR family regulator